MRFVKLHGTKLIISLALIAGLALVSFTYGAISTNAATPSNQPTQNIKAVAKFPVNKNGETYGSNSEVTNAEQEPDLILAQGVDGTVGYIKRADLEKGQPKNPEEAVAYMKKMQNSPPIKIPLYDADGEKVIGEFKLDTPERIEITGGSITVYNH